MEWRTNDKAHLQPQAPKENETILFVLEPRLRGDAAMVGEGGLEVEAEVGEVPPFAQAAGTHGKGVATAGGEEPERSDGGFGVELVRHLI